MAKQRVQVAAPQPSTRLTPRAAPVDTYHSPLTPLPEQSNSLLELAKGLEALTPGLGAFLDMKQGQYQTEQIDEGAKAALLERNKAGFKTAIDRGDIPAGASPWFQKGYRAQKQRLAAEEYSSAMKQAWANSSVKEIDDPGAARDFAQKFTETWVQQQGLDQDREFAQVFAPQAAQAQAELLQMHTQHRLQAVERAVQENTAQEITNLLKREYESGITVGPNGPAQAGDVSTAGVISDLLKAQISNGLSGTVANDLAADAVIEFAKEKLDSSVLDVLDQIPAGSGVLGDITRIRQAKREAQSYIWRATEENQALEAKQLKEQRHALSKELVGKAYQELIANPATDIRGMMATLSSVDPEMADKVLSFRGAWIRSQDDRPEDAEGAALITNRAYGGEATLPDLMDAYRQGTINQATLKKLASELPRAEQMRGVLGNPIVAEMDRGIGMAIRGNENDYKPEAAVRALHAQGQFKSLMIDFLNKNPNATQLDILRHAGDARDTILKAYIPDDFEGAVNRPLNPEMALQLPRESIEWNRKPVFASEQELQEAVAEYDASRGTTGRLARLLGHLGVSGRELISAQLAVFARLSQQPTK